MQIQTARSPFKLLETVEEIAELFIHAGVHLDGVNIHGLTAIQLCTSGK